MKNMKNRTSNSLHRLGCHAFYGGACKRPTNRLCGAEGRRREFAYHYSTIFGYIIMSRGDSILIFNSIKDFKDNCSLEDYRILYIVEDDEFMVFTGLNEYQEFCIKLNISILNNWEYSVCDFILYNNNNGYESIVIANADILDAALSVMEYCRQSRTSLRFYEPKYLIHSTTLDNWEKIKNDIIIMYFIQ